MQCHNSNLPPLMTNVRNMAVISKAMISLIRDDLTTLNGFTRAMDPATTAVMNDAAPMSSPMAILLLSSFIAANVEKISGLPLPRARRVTPAKVSFIRSPRAIELKLTEKKSPATVPKAVKRIVKKKRIRTMASGCKALRRQ